MESLPDTFWEWYRMGNIGFAVLGLLLNLAKLPYIWKQFDFDSRMGFASLMSWNVTFIAAGTWAQLDGHSSGPWAALMTIPIMWSVMAGLYNLKGEQEFSLRYDRAPIKE